MKINLLVNLLKDVADFLKDCLPPVTCMILILVSVFPQIILRALYINTAYTGFKKVNETCFKLVLS